MKLEKQKIVKAEILFSRKCNLKCSYCNMADGRSNTLSVENWRKGIDQLKLLNCKFIGFYGAEPLLEFNKLLEVVPYAEHIGIDTTIITNGTIVGTQDKLQRLYAKGATSLSMSYDPVPIDKSSEIKSKKALELLSWFKNLGTGVRDVAAIATLTNQNYESLPGMVKLMSSLGIWTFYDLYHYNQGQPGSKCGKYDPELAIRDTNKLLESLYAVKQLKKEGFLVHTNNHYLDVLNKKTSKKWNCADYDVFPSWVTVDCDGVVYPCDDFQPPEAQEFCITNIYENWVDWKKKMKFLTKALCPGCYWNSHIGAHAIAVGLEDINDYIHRG